MCFLYWCFREAASQLGVVNHMPRTGGVHRAWSLSRQKGAPVEIVTARAAQTDPARVKPGMVFFLDTGRGRGHAGLVVARIGSGLETIEGNTTTISGSREGIGVFRRTRRKIRDINLGFAGYG